MFLNISIIVILSCCCSVIKINSLPLNSVKNSETSKAGNSLETFLSLYYDQYVRNTDYEKELMRTEYPVSKIPEDDPQTKNVLIYDTMQGDQPIAEENIVNNVIQPSSRSLEATSPFQPDVIKVIRDRTVELNRENRTKDSWIQSLKMKILQQTGRSNASTNVPADSRMPPLNFSQLFPHVYNQTQIENDFIKEKIRSYYPSCSVPGGTESETWDEDKYMNLYFNYSSVERPSNIAAATLRLYRMPVGTSDDSKDKNCNATTPVPDEKLLRISIFWYTRSSHRRRSAARKRLCDSKVIFESAKWVELNVRPAARGWIKEENLGLAVQVEDQDGRTLKADKYFKGVSCSVGMSTTTNPNVQMDQPTDARFHGLLGRNSTKPVSGNLFMLPRIEVCVLEFPKTYPANMTNVDRLPVRACHLKHVQEVSQHMLEKDQLERMVTLSDYGLPSLRHMRHQRQQHKIGPAINSQVLITKDELYRHFNLTRT